MLKLGSPADWLQDGLAEPSVLEGDALDWLEVPLAVVVTLRFEPLLLFSDLDAVLDWLLVGLPDGDGVPADTELLGESPERLLLSERLDLVALVEILKVVERPSRVTVSDSSL